MALGFGLVIAKIGTDRYWLIGILLIVVGLALAAAAQFASRALRERPDLTE